MRSKFTSAIASVTVLLLPCFGFGAVVVNETDKFNTTSQTFYPASTSNLVNQGSPVNTLPLGAGTPSSTFASQTTTNYTAIFTTGIPRMLNDGSLGGVNDLTNTVISNTNYTTTFHLNTATNIVGYNITEIDTIAGWTDKRVWQKYSVYYSTINSNPLGNDVTGYSLLQTVIFQPSISLNGSYSTEVTLAVTGLSRVNAIQFQVTADGGGTQSVYREFDVIGIPTVPEPASMGLFFAAGLLAMHRRIRA